MHVVIFAHSLRSDWNHGNAHFLRGIVSELVRRGHHVRCLEPADAWSVQHLVAAHGTGALEAMEAAYPRVRPEVYDAGSVDIPALVEGADLVLVHEWNDPALVAGVGRCRREGARFRLLFHDTHHRSATAPDEMARYDLRDYDGVLAFGAVIRDLYLERGWTQRAWTWHEAADTSVFRPPGARGAPEGDLVWIGNWGDDERTVELQRFLLEPVRALGLSATIHGVRYPAHALAQLERSGIAYRGWLPNFEAPAAFARHRVTVHVPRRPYALALPGIPTIRPFEALACGIPLVSAPWDDAESLFRPGTDYLVAEDGEAMQRHLRAVLHDDALAAELAARGLETIRSRHTCAHRVDELLRVHDELAGGAALEASRSGSTLTPVAR
jgi:spore maturation protein CgeB